MTKAIAIPAPRKVEGESLDVDHVLGFVEFVYGAVSTADSASYVCRHLVELVDTLEGLGVSAADVRRYRARVDRAIGVANRMEADPRSAIALVPPLMEAAGFDSGLHRATTHWAKAATKVNRVDEGWAKIGTFAIPIARRAMGLATIRLAAGGERSREIGGLDVATALDLYQRGQDTVAEESRVEHTERLVVSGDVSDLVAVGGAVGHAMAGVAAAPRTRLEMSSHDSYVWHGVDR